MARWVTNQARLRTARPRGASALVVARVLVLVGSAADWNGRGAQSAFKGPAADVIDLLFHRARQWYDGDRDIDQIFFRHRAFFELRFGQGRDHALFYLGAGPTVGERRQTFQIEFIRVYAAPVEMNFEDLQALILQRHVDEEDLIKAPLADHFRRQQIDPVGGGRHEQAAGLFLHPGQEESRDASLLAT